MSLDPNNLFQPYIPPSIVQQGQDLTKTHYAINLGAVKLNINMYQFDKPMRRGIIYPVSGNDRKENNADGTDEVNEIIQGYYQPGLIANAIERDFQDKGFRVLRNITGYDLNDVQRLHEFFKFEDTAHWSNAKIIEFLKEAVEKKKHPEMAEYLLRQLSVINGYQLQHMLDQKKAINDGLKPGLNEYDRAVCRAIGRNPSDYEVNEVERRKAAAEAQGNMIEDFAKAVVSATAGAGATPGIDVANIKKENDTLRETIEKQGKALETQGKILERLQVLLKDKEK